MASKSLVEMFFLGGWVMWPLLLFSVLTWAVILERAYTYFTIRPRLSKLAGSVIRSLEAGDAAAARQICHSEKAPVADVFLGTLETKRPRDHAERITDRNRLRMMAYLRKHLWILGTIATSSPFIGLLGTVIGIVRAFHEMGEKGAGGFNVVASGISEALVATAAGLIVAIVALISYNILVTAANQTIAGLKLTLEELLDHSFTSAA